VSEQVIDDTGIARQDSLLGFPAGAGMRLDLKTILLQAPKFTAGNVCPATELSEVDLLEIKVVSLFVLYILDSLCYDFL
jgi:hypothetical protein